MTQAKLGIIAGRGGIPRALIETCQAENREFFVIAIKGETEQRTVEGVPHVWRGIGGIGGTMDILRREGCQEVVLIGPIDRPDLKNLQLDFKGAALLPKLLAAAKRGDDALLTIVVEALEKGGLRVVAAETILANLTAPSGQLGQHAPGQEDISDVARGREVLAALGNLDIGQAVVVRDGRVLAVEAAEGTDLMLHRCIAFRTEAGADMLGGVLIKGPKPDQERRVDLPTLGAATVDICARAGLRGIAFEAGGALLTGRRQMIERADELGLFLLGYDPQATCP